MGDVCICLWDSARCGDVGVAAAVFVFFFGVLLSMEEIIDEEIMDRGWGSLGGFDSGTFCCWDTGNVGR
jgi:hypothetical protein